MSATPYLRLRRTRPHASRGFTMIELLLVVAVSAVIAAVAIPSYTSIQRYLRINEDGRSLNALVALAKMRAAQDYTHARVRANLAASTYQLEVWSKSLNSGNGCWKTDNDTYNRCTNDTTSPVVALSTGVQFGFGTVGAGAPNPQTIFGQAPACTTGVAGPNPGGTKASTACIEFNSRGLPVDSTNLPTANDALYITDSDSVYGITVIISGLIQDWKSTASATAWQAR